VVLNLTRDANNSSRQRIHWVGKHLVQGKTLVACKNCDEKVFIAEVWF